MQLLWCQKLTYQDLLDGPLEVILKVEVVSVQLFVKSVRGVFFIVGVPYEVERIADHARANHYQLYPFEHVVRP